MNPTHSQQVAWFTVWEFVAPRLAPVGARPSVGTPDWQNLNDDDPRKIAAVLDAGVQWALRIDAEQTARAEASQAVSTAIRWKATAERMLRGRGPSHIPRVKAS